MQLFKTAARSRGLSFITVKYTTTSIIKDIFKADRIIGKMHICYHTVVSNLRFIGSCDRGTLRRVMICLTTPALFQTAPLNDCQMD
tara:strand:- start:445 stop:702 length:258 start_codon:yes stop_codon:yes gene_type:complete